MQPEKVLVWLAGLSVLDFWLRDMYFRPRLPPLQADCKTPAAAVSASLSLFLAGFAVAQLSGDRYRIVGGRKPILPLGLSIFAPEVWGCCG